MATVLDHALQEYLVPVEDSDYKFIERNGMVKSHRLAALVCDLKPSMCKSHDPDYMYSLMRTDTKLGYVFDKLRTGIRSGEVPRQDKEVMNPNTVGEESFLIRVDNALRWLIACEIAIPDKVTEYVAALQLPSSVAARPVQTMKKQNIDKGGAPSKYEWDDFDKEMLRIADVDGLGSGAEGKRELTEKMKSWVTENWAEPPDDRQIRDRVSKKYPY